MTKIHKDNQVHGVFKDILVALADGDVALNEAIQSIEAAGVFVDTEETVKMTVNHLIEHHTKDSTIPVDVAKSTEDDIREAIQDAMTESSFAEFVAVNHAHAFLKALNNVAMDATIEALSEGVENELKRILRDLEEE